MGLCVRAPVPVGRPGHTCGVVFLSPTVLETPPGRVAAQEGHDLDQAEGARCALVMEHRRFVVESVAGNLDIEAE